MTFPASSSRHTSDISQALAEHEGLVHWVVRRQWLGELPYAEARHEGRIALWRAVVGYDVRRGTAFSTYAVHAIWRAVDRARPQPQEVLTPDPPSSARELLSGSGGPPGPGQASEPALDRLAQAALVREALHFACAWSRRTGLEAATMDERNVFPDTFAYVRQRFPYLNIGEGLALWNGVFHRAGRCRPGLPGLPGPHRGSRGAAHGGHSRRRGGR